jgi:hypothetical protein
VCCVSTTVVLHVWQQSVMSCRSREVRTKFYMSIRDVDDVVLVLELGSCPNYKG